FGWIQIHLPANTYAVLFTKTSGFEEEVIKPGEFVWRVEKLIPKNMIIYSFEIKPHSTIVELHGSLPSGEVYASTLDAKPDFSYSLEFFITFILKPEQLPRLVMDEKLFPDQLDDWYRRIADECAVEASSFLSSKFRDPAYLGGINYQYETLAEELRDHINGFFQSIRIINIIPRKVEFPDLELYQRAKEQYLALLEERQRIFIEETREAARKEAVEENRIKTLSRYGELLSKYPILLKYLALESGKVDIPAEIFLEKVE
ncbi:MAG: hypothetical protein DRP87_18995, partial [Spirochaetes bacterium]